MSCRLGFGVTRHVAGRRIVGVRWIFCLAFAVVTTRAAAQSMAPGNSSSVAPVPSEPLAPLPAAPPLSPPVAAPPIAPATPPTGTDAGDPSDLAAVKSGFEVGFRVAYGLPLGQATAEPGDDLSRSFGGQLPFTLDLGARLGSQFFLGGYLGYGPGGFGSGATQCAASGVTCSTSTARLGVELQYSFLKHGRASPWVGYGAGYEISNLNAKGPAGEANLNVGGFEFGHLMAGIDYRVLNDKKHPREFGFGPFVDLSLAQFTRETQDVNGATRSAGSIANPGFHEWLMIGVRFVALP